MRLVVTGKTRSGKSTAVHRILVHALRQKWAGVILLDGKGGELDGYKGVPGVKVLGPKELEPWAESLERHAESLSDRYEALQQRGLREAGPDDLTWLIIADDVQRGTRAGNKVGKRIRDAISAICEQSGALGDVVILLSQREPNSIPPTARENASARLRILGGGYFFFQADGYPTQSGRVSYITPTEALAMVNGHLPGDEPAALPLTLANLPTLLGSQPTEPTRAPATLYLGPPGSGRTYALKHHPHGSTRCLYTDFAQPHRQAIVGVIEAAGAIVPPKARIPELIEIASLALRSEPTLLLIDNLDKASPKALLSIPHLMNAAQAVALAATTPEAPPERRKLESLLPRCEVQELKPLPADTARRLLWENLDRAAVNNPAATERRVVAEAGGNPRTIVQLAHRIKKGDARELRMIYTTAPRVNLSWLFLVIVISFAMIARWQVDSYTVAGILFAIALVLRPLLYRSMRRE